MANDRTGTETRIVGTISTCDRMALIHEIIGTRDNLPDDWVGASFLVLAGPKMSYKEFEAGRDADFEIVPADCLEAAVDIAGGVIIRWYEDEHNE